MNRLVDTTYVNDEFATTDSGMPWTHHTATKRITPPRN